MTYEIIVKYDITNFEFSKFIPCVWTLSGNCVSVKFDKLEFVNTDVILYITIDMRDGIILFGHISANDKIEPCRSVLPYMIKCNDDYLLVEDHYFIRKERTAIMMAYNDRFDDFERYIDKESGLDRYNIHTCQLPCFGRKG